MAIWIRVCNHAKQRVWLSHRIPPSRFSQKIIAIGVLPENLPALDAANDNGMQRSRPI